MANTTQPVTTDTVIKLIIRRGTNVDRQSVILASGELGYAVDTKRVYIGDGVTYGGNLIGNVNFGIVQGIEGYIGLAQNKDIIFQNLKSDGTADNILYSYDNGTWQNIHPQYSQTFDYTSGMLEFNKNFIYLTPGNTLADPATFTVVGNISALNALSSNSATIYFQPVINTDATNKLFVDTRVDTASASCQQYSRDYSAIGYVPLSGRTLMFGTLSSTTNVNISAVPVINYDLTNKQYVDQLSYSTLTAAAAYTANRFLHLSGGTLTDSLTAEPGLGSRNIAPAVYIKQVGNQPALLIQDTNRTIPRSFYVDNYGNVGIGVRPPSDSNTQLSIVGVTSASNNVYIGGRTGIGTTSPDTQLHVHNIFGSSSMRVTAPNDTSSNAALQLGALGTNGYALYNEGSTGNLKLNRDVPIGTGTINFITATPEGNIGIKTTPSATTLYPFAVNGDTLVTGTLTTSKSAKITGNLYATGNITALGFLSAYGDVIAYTSSDERLKENVTPIASALDKIDKITGVSFDWNTDLQDTYSGHDVGVLAQEIEAVLPEAVVTRSDGYKAVRYEKIIPLLLQAIKELKSNQK